MSVLMNASIRVDKLPKEKFIKGKDGAVYYNLTVSVQDESRFGNNVSIFDSQTKEERDAKKNRNYLGNGRVIWTDGNVLLSEKTEEVSAKTEQETSDLPF